MSGESDLEKSMRHLRTAQDGLRKATSNVGSPGLRAAVTEMVNAVEEVNLVVAELGQTKNEDDDRIKQIIQTLDEYPNPPAREELFSIVDRIRKIACPRRGLTAGDLTAKLFHAEVGAVVTIEIAGMGSYPVTSTDMTVHSSDGEKVFGLYSDDLNEVAASILLKRD